MFLKFNIKNTAIFTDCGEKKNLLLKKIKYQLITYEAGDKGFEPLFRGSEPRVLPLHQSPGKNSPILTNGGSYEHFSQNELKPV